MLTRGGCRRLRVSASAVLMTVTVALASCAVASHTTDDAGPDLSSASEPVAAPVSSAETTMSSPAVPPQPSGLPQDPNETSNWMVLGTSVEGRPIRALTLGNGPRTVLFVGGIHGDEAEGAHTTAELPRAFFERGLASAVTLTIIEDINPDGRAANTRSNANGVDINRNFPASNFDGGNSENGGEALSQPESRVLHDTITRADPALVLVTHSWNGREFVNFDGPARPIAERFGQSSGMAIEDSSSFAPTPGSLGSFVGRDLNKPILTIEVLRGSDPIQVWDRLRAALLDAIAG